MNSSLLEKIRDLFGFRAYRCCGCDKAIVSRDTVYRYKKTCICQKCFDNLEKNKEMLPVFGEICKDLTLSPFYYEGLYREIFLKFKFKGFSAYGHILGMAIGDLIAQTDYIIDCDYITVVPLSQKRYYERGYNQSQIMAEYISEKTGIPIKNILKRKKHTNPQSNMQGAKRTTNIKDAFEVTKNIEGDVIVLFDDIHTTGSTMHECSETLLLSGAEKVFLITAAYVREKDKTIYY